MFSIRDNKVYPVWNQEEEKAWFADRLGNLDWFNVLSPEEATQILNSIPDIAGKGIDAHGWFYNSAIYILSNAAETTTFHESYHLVESLALSNSQISSLNRTNTEEDRATLFANYVQLANIDDIKLKQTSFWKQLGAKLQRVFRKLYLSIKAAVGLNLTQEEIFYRINNKAYKNFKPKRNVDTFKPSIRAYINPTKQADRINLVNRYFLSDLDKLRDKLKLEKPSITEKEVLERAILPTSSDNVYKQLSIDFNRQEELLEDEDLTQDEKDYLISEYKEISNKLWNESDGYGSLYQVSLKDLKKYGIRVKSLKMDIERQEDVDTREMWMEINESPFESFSTLLKKGIGTLIQTEFTGKKELDKNGVATGFREVKYINDDLGFQRHVDIAETYSKILEATTGSLNVEDMMNKIRELADEQAWAIQLYQTLTGARPSTIITNPEWFKSQLYYTASQSPVPDFRYLWETYTKPFQYSDGSWSKSIHQWIFSKSTTKGLTEKLQKQWNTNISRESTNRLLKNGIIDENKLEQVKARLQDKNDVVILHNILNGIGITIPKDAVEKIIKKDKGDLQKWTEQIINNIEKPESKPVTDAVEAISKLAKRYFPEYHQASHNSVENETVNNYIRNSFMARQIEKFKRGMVDFYRADSFYVSNDSGNVDLDLWLDRFETDASEKLTFAVLDGIKYANNQSTVFQDMSPLEFAQLSLMAFYNNGAGMPTNYGMGKAFYSAQLMADSGSHAYIGFESYTNDVVVKKLMQVVQREYNAILDHRRNPIAIKGNEPKFMLIPGVTEEMVLDKVRLEKYIRGGLKATSDKALIEFVKSGLIVEGKDKKTGATIYTSKHLDSRIKDIESFIETFTYNDYYAQTQITSLFHGKLFMYKSMEDFYKRAKEIWSPGNFINAQQEGVNKEYFTYFVKSEILNYDNNKKVIDDIMTNMRLVGIDEQIVVETGAKYGFTDGTIVDNKPGVTLSNGTKVKSGETDATDAQGIIDIHRWREISLGKGIDPKEVSRIYDAVLNDTYTINDLTMILNPFKQFFYGLSQVSTDKGTVVVPTQIKNSEYVLLPQIAKGNPELELILQKLEEGRIEHGINGSINFNSAVKVGERNLSQSVADITPNKANRFLNEEYRIQGEVPEHQVESENILGSQFRKLILGEISLDEFYKVAGLDTLGSDIKNEWNQLLIADIQEEWDRISREFNTSEKFYKMLQEEANNRDYPEKFIDALTLVNGEPRLALSSPMLIKKSVALISAIYRNHITKMKFPGQQVANVTAYGLKEQPQIVYNEDRSIKYFEAYAPLSHKWLADYLTKDGFVDVKKLEEANLDMGIAYRIPTENKYSMVPMKIIGFTNAGLVLPKVITTVAGLDFDIDKMFVMLYSFKVDKGKPVKVQFNENITYSEYKNTVKRSGEAKTLAKELGYNIEGYVGENALQQWLADVNSTDANRFFQEGFTLEEVLQDEGILLDESEWNNLSIWRKNSRAARDNRKLDIALSILTDKKTLQAQLVPGGFVELENEAKRIATIKGMTDEKINPMTLLSRQTIFERMMAGKKLIGIPANYNATHALMQGSNLRLTKPVLFNSKEGSDLGAKYITDTNITVTSEIAQFLASVVDNGKNPLANLYNLNTYTADVVLLITKFFGKEVAMRFSAQPIITEFYKRYVNYGSNRKAELRAATELLGTAKEYYDGLKEDDINIDNEQLETGLADSYTSNIQRDILKQFLRYKKNQAKDLSKLVNAIKVPDNGMRSTLEKTISGIDRVKEVLNVSTIEGISDFFSNKDFANNVLYDYGITKPMEKFVDLGFPDYQGEDSAYLQLRDYFTAQKGEPLNDTELTLIHDAAMTYLSAGFQPLSNIDKDKVIKETPVLLKLFAEKNVLGYSKLIGSLTISPSEIEKDTQIITLEQNQSRDSENDIMEQWENLKNSGVPINEKYTEGDLGKMLIEYAFISNGFRFAPGSLAHIQPLSFYKTLVDESGKSYNTFMKQSIHSANNDKNFLEGFKSQFVRHYFPRLSYIKEFDKDTASIRYEETTKEPFMVELQDADAIVDYIKVQNKVQGKKSWFLFKRDADTNNYYRLEPLGLYREFEEWGDNVHKFSFPINRVSQVVIDAYDAAIQAKNTVQEIPAPIIVEPVIQKQEKVLNEEQQDAVNAALDFIETGSPKDYFVIEGKAGTGKTFLAEQIVKAFPRKFTYVAALSHKAKSVIRSKFEEAGVKAKFESLASLLGQKLNMETGEFERNPESLVAPPISYADIIIIDEASMINEQTLELIFQYKPRKAKVIFLGDIGQLPPIRTVKNKYYINRQNLFGKKSPVFNTNDKARLLTRVRQGEESPILPFADYFWENSQKSNPVDNPVKVRENSITNKGALVFVNNFADIKDEVIDSFRKAVDEKNPNHIKVVTYRNNARMAINEYVHRTLYGMDAQEYNDGELIIFNDSYGKIENATEAQILEPSKIKTDKHGIKYIMARIEYQDELIDIQILASESKTEWNNLVSKAFKDAFALKGTDGYKEALSDAWGMKNRFANIDYGYAITSHKSQGSTYDIVVVDEKDIMGVGAITAKEKSESIYTAITRAKNVTVVISSQKVEDANIPTMEELNNKVTEQVDTETGEVIEPITDESFEQFKNTLDKTC